MKKLLLLFAAIVGFIGNAQTPLKPLTLPFYENFESATGVFTGNNLCVHCDSLVHWSFKTSNQAYGRLSFNLGFSNKSIGVTDNVGASMDANGGSLNFLSDSLIGTFDLSNYHVDSAGFVGLSFYHLDHGNLGFIYELVWIRGSSSDSWIEVYNLHDNSVENQWVYSGYLDVTKHLRSNNQNFSSTFQVKFGHQGFRRLTSSGSKDGRTIDDISLVFENCLQFATPVFTNINASSAVLNTSDSSATIEIEYGPCGFNQGNGTFQIDSMGSVTIQGLISNTCYDVYLRRKCGSNSSSTWAGPFKLNTACAYTAPYFRDFENFVIPAIDSCFTGLTGRNSNLSVESAITPNPAFSGSVSINMSKNFSASPDLIFVTPEFTDLDSNKQISFYLNRYNGTADLLVGTLQDPKDPTTFVHYKTIANSDMGPSYTWREHVVDFRNYKGTNRYVGFKYDHINKTGLNLYLDNLLYEETPTCFAPSLLSLSVDSIFGSSAKVSWGSSGSGNETFIIWGYKGFNPAIGFAGVDSVSGNDSTYIITGLDQRKAYDFYIQDSCGTDGLSRLIGPLTFYTGCAPMPAVLPIFDGFENDSGVVASDTIFHCYPSHYWSIERYGYGKNGTLRFDFDTTGNFQHHKGYRSAKLSSNSQNDSIFLILTADLSNYANTNSSVELSYFFADHGNPTHAANKVWARGGINDPWVPMYDWEARANGWSWTKDSVYLDTLLSGYNQYLSSTTQIRWVQKGSSFSPERGFGLDDVWLKEVSCIKPASFKAQALSQTAIAFTWDEVLPGGSFEVWVGSAGFYQGPQTKGGAKFIGTGDSLWVGTLQNNSCYDVLIRRLCSTGDSSEWVGPINVCTSCGDITTPYFEDFDGLPAGLSGNLGNCWIAASSRPNISNPYIFKTNKGSTPSANTGPSGDAGTGRGTYVYIESVGSYGFDMATLTTLNDVDVTSVVNPELRFSYHMYGAQTSSLKVQVNSGNGWTTLRTISGQQHSSIFAPWTKTIVPLSGHGNRFKLRFQSQKGAVGVGDIAIDNIEIDKPVTCIKPSAITLSNLSQTGVSITVTPGGALAHTMQLSYGPALSNPANGTKTVFMGGNHILSNLISSTEYCIYIRAICGIGDTSYWYGPYCFSTPCPDIAAPYSQSFDSTNVSEVPPCWHATPPDYFTVAVVDSTDRGIPLPSMPHCLELNENTSSPVIAVSPPFSDLANGLNQVRVKVSYEISSANFSDTLFIGTMLNPTDISTFRKLGYFDVKNNNATFKEYIFELVDTSLIGNNRHIVFMYDQTPGGNFEYYVDDFYYEPIPCLKADNLRILSDSCQSVTLSWDSHGASSFLEYGLSGFIPGQGTRKPLLQSPHTLTGLQGLANYDVYVLNVCGSDTSGYDAPLSFRADNDLWLTGSINVASRSYTDTTINYSFIVKNPTTGLSNSYRWDFGNGITAKGSVGNVQYVTPGMKTVVLSAMGQCFVNDTMVVNINIGLPENEVITMVVDVFPNPANDEVHLKAGNLKCNELEVALYDSKGAKLDEQIVRTIDGVLYKTLSLKGMPAGVYSIHIKSKEGKLVKKLIKE
jgi:hypothetical protein